MKKILENAEKLKIPAMLKELRLKVPSVRMMLATLRNVDWESKILGFLAFFVAAMILLMLGNMVVDIANHPAKLVSTVYYDAYFERYMIFSRTTIMRDDRGFPGASINDEEYVEAGRNIPVGDFYYVVDAGTGRIHISIGRDYILAPDLSQMPSVTGVLIVHRDHQILGAVEVASLTDFDTRLAEIETSDHPIIEIMPHGLGAGADHLYSTTIYCTRDNADFQCNLGMLLADQVTASYRAEDGQCYLISPSFVNVLDENWEEREIYVPTAHCRERVKEPGWIPYDLPEINVFPPVGTPEVS